LCLNNKALACTIAHNLTANNAATQLNIGALHRLVNLDDVHLSGAVDIAKWEAHEQVADGSHTRLTLEGSGTRLADTANILNLSGKHSLHGSKLCFRSCL
jgi:hypothetical protein